MSSSGFGHLPFINAAGTEPGLGLLSQSAAPAAAPGQGPPALGVLAPLCLPPLPPRILAASSAVPLGAEQRARGFQSWAFARSAGVITGGGVFSGSGVGGLLVHSGDDPVSVISVHTNTRTVPCVLCLCLCGKALLPALWKQGVLGLAVGDVSRTSLGSLWVRPQLPRPWIFLSEKWG